MQCPAVVQHWGTQVEACVCLNQSSTISIKRQDDVRAQERTNSELKVSTFDNVGTGTRLGTPPMSSKRGDPHSPIGTLEGCRDMREV